MTKRSIYLTEQIQAEEKLMLTVNTVGTCMSCGDFQHAAMDVHNAERWTTLRKYAEAKAGKPPKITWDIELFLTHAKTMRTQRWKHMSEHSKSKFSTVTASDQSVLIANVVTKRYQKTDMCKCKLDTGSDGKLMPIRMYVNSELVQRLKVFCHSVYCSQVLGVSKWSAPQGIHEMLDKASDGSIT